MKKIILLSATVLIMTGCTPTYEDLTQWMTQTRLEAKSQIIPFEAPTVTPPKAYIPPSYSGLNAFNSRRLDNIPQGGNAPNLRRRKETLEAFSLENLRYVGRLVKGSRVSGFIQAEDHTYTVMPGNYIGQNHGKIQRITEDKIIITELIEDSYGNWIYRTAELPLSSQSAANINNTGNSPVKSAPASQPAVQSSPTPSANDSAPVLH